MPGYKIVLRKNGAKRGELTGYATKSSALAEAQTLADSAGGGVKVYVEPVKAKANRKAPRRRNTQLKKGQKVKLSDSAIARMYSGDRASRKRWRGTIFEVIGPKGSGAGIYGVEEYERHGEKGYLVVDKNNPHGRWYALGDVVAASTATKKAPRRKNGIIYSPADFTKLEKEVGKGFRLVPGSGYFSGGENIYFVDSRGHEHMFKVGEFSSQSLARFAKAISGLSYKGGELYEQPTRRKKNTKRLPRAKLAWTVVEGPRHLWKAVNTRTGAEVVGSLDQFRYADWRKDHGLPEYIKHIVLHKAYERSGWGARGNPKRKNAIYGSGTDAKFAQWQKKTGLSKAKLEKLAQEAYRMGDDEHMSTLALGKHFKKHLKQKSPSEKTLRQFGDFLFEWGWLELPRLPRTRYNSRRKNYSTGETWLQEADTEMEEEGTVGAFTKQARRAGYKDTMAFARAVMKGWRSGKKTVYNKKTRKQQRITKKTMYRANFAINAQKRRNPFSVSDHQVRKVIDDLKGRTGKTFVQGIQNRTGLSKRAVVTILEDRLGYSIEGQGIGKPGFIRRQNPIIDYTPSGVPQRRGDYRWVGGPYGTRREASQAARFHYPSSGARYTDSPPGLYVDTVELDGVYHLYRYDPVKKANPLSAQDERIVHHILEHHAVSGVTPGELAKCMGGNTSAYRTKLNSLVKKGWLRKDGRYRYRIVRENPALRAIGGAIGKGLGAAGKAAWTGTKRAAQYGVEYGKEAGARATESAKTAAFATNIADLERCAKRLGITGDELSQLEPYRQAVEAIREHEEKTGAAREARGSRRASALAKRWNPTPGKRGWIPVLFGSNLIILGIGRDRNGNKIIKLSYPNSRGFSIQTLGTPMHSLLRGVTARYEILPDMSTKLEPMLIDHIRKYGSAKQKKGLRVY